MTKQEFLAMSLPHELRCEISNKKVCYKLASYTATDYALEFNDKGIIGTPILHPLSDLTKEIEHKGEKFVPMVELSKLAGFEPQQLDPIDEIVAICNNYSISFGYEKGSFFAGRINFKENDWIEDITIKNQLQLFSKLIEWHFSLMDEGEKFIDVNTLEENPYK